MKKLPLFAGTILLFVAVSVESVAQGFNSSYAIINAGADVYYCMPSNTSCGSNPSLDGASLGSFRQGSSSLILKGGQVNNYKCSGQDITSARLNYRIYLSASPTGSYTAINLPWSSETDNGCGGKDQQWQNLTANVDVLNGLIPGNYTIEFYCDQSTTAGTQYLSNSSNNYKASFTVYRDFITTWKTDNAGSTGSTSIRIPTTGAGYNYDVDWNNDGVYDQFGITGDVIHNFGVAGTYTIRIRGAFPRIFMKYYDSPKLLEVSQWGSITLTSMAGAFQNCSNLNITATDLPDMVAVTDMSDMFRDCHSLNGPANIGSWNTAAVTNMTGLFAFATAFNQPVGAWTTSSVTNMSYMFAYATSFNQPVGGWNTAAVTQMEELFNGASSFNQSVANWSTSNVNSMFGLFYNAISFNQSLGNWTLKSNVDMTLMLDNCGMDCSAYSATLIGWRNNPLTPTGRVLGATGRQYSTGAVAARGYLTGTKGWSISGDAASGSNCDPGAFITTWKTNNPGISGNTSIFIYAGGAVFNYDVDWNNDGVYDQLGITGSVTHDFGVAGSYTIRIRGSFPIINFYNGDRLKLLDISQWGSISWTYLSFYGCSNLNITATDVPNLNGVTSMSGMFSGCSSLNGPANIGNWNTALVTNMSNMFYGAASFNQPVGSWNTGAVTNMSYMFYGANSFNQPIGNWNTSAVTNLNNMFNGAAAFNQPIGSWNTTSVTSMGFMFKNAISFDQPIGNWNTASVTDMTSMFEGATSFNEPIWSWNTGSVTNMSGMFSFATSFNHSIGDWNTGNVTNMSGMFYNAGAFNQPIGGWNTSSVTNMSFMFYGAALFNQPIGNWNTSAVTNMYRMFYSATTFNQPIGNWNTSVVQNIEEMFQSAIAFNQPIDNWNVSSVYNMLHMFRYSGINQNLGKWTFRSAGVDIRGLFNNSAMNCASYSATLVGWRYNPLTPTGLNLGANAIQYNYTGFAAQEYLRINKGWLFSDGGNAASSILGAVSGGVQVCQSADVSHGRMYTDGCNSLLMITPSGASPVSGSINACVKVDNTVQLYNGQPYLQRHFDITPATNPTTSTARITLYVLQSEFDTFNSARGIFPALPTGAADAAGIANLRITQLSGTGTAPGNYTPGTRTLIDPDDADIVWNGYHWEISFNVTGFSGFYIHTLIYNAPLPVSLLSFSGYKQGSVNKLSWTTVSEQNNRGFAVERSADGVNYSAIGFVNTLAVNGNSDASLSYSFTDANPTGSKQYYRLRQADVNGGSRMSNVIVIRGEKATVLTIDGLYPNPASSQLNVALSIPARGTVTLQVVDITGRILAQQVKAIAEGSNTVSLNVAGLSNGSYILKVVNAETGAVSAKFSKQ